MTLDLPAFLHARLDEAADDAARGYLTAPAPGEDYDGWDKTTMAGLPPLVARMVLADIDAKRRLLEEFSHYQPGDSGYPEFLTAARLAALSYAGHEDYREEWKP